MSANDKPTTPITPDEAFFEGIIDRGAQRTVAIAVNVNFELKDGQRERGHAVPIHVIPLMRRQHPNGVVKVLASWARGVPRCKDLTQEELKSELEGFARTYGAKMAGQPASCLAEVYGATEVEQLKTLHAKMGLVYRAWIKLEQEALKRVAQKYPGQTFSKMALYGVVGQVITDEEMNELVSIIEPEREELAEIQLDDLASVMQASADDAVNGDADGQVSQEVDPVEWLAIELETQLKLSEQDAMTLTSLILDCGEIDPEPKRLAEIKALQKSDGTLHANKGATIKRIIDLYRKRAAATPAAHMA